MRRSETNELKQKLKRLGLFILIVFLPVMAVAIVLQVVVGLEMWQNMLVLVVLIFLLYFAFLWLCSKLDKKKAERLSKKNDPFS